MRRQSIEDLQLIAWHHMINDPYLTVYTIDENGREHREYVNPKLAYKRAILNLNNELGRMAEQFRQQLFPAFDVMAIAMKGFADSFNQLGLGASITIPDEVD